MGPGYGDEVSVLTEASDGYVPTMRRTPVGRGRGDGRAFATAFCIVIYVGTALPVIAVGFLALSTGLLPAVRTFAWVIGVAAFVVLVVVARVERRAARPHLARTGVGS
jgi:hypothetical protein